MCLTCGCGDTAGVRITSVNGHDHSHSDITELPSDRETLVIEEELLAKNARLAAHVRAHLEASRICAINVMSSPGSGKTTLLERTIAERPPGREVCVIEGDQETAVDAERIRHAGARAVQVNTGAGCHLDADMVHRALDSLSPPVGSLLFVENVGNLVCPALFDIGENARVVVISVTEGDDKPLKYPHMFAAADLVVVNKTDLLPYVDFDVSRLSDQARSLKPSVSILPMSVRTGAGLDAWFDWLDRLAGTELKGTSHGATVGS